MTLRGKSPRAGPGAMVPSHAVITGRVWKGQGITVERDDCVFLGGRWQARWGVSRAIMWP